MDDIVEVYRAANPLEADFLQGILSEEGIQVILTKEEGVKMTSGALAVVPLIVRAQDRDRARELIDAAIAGEFAIDDDYEESE